MAPPSQLSIATSSIDRLLKEESSYRLELAHQQNHLEKLQIGGPGGVDDVLGNSEFLVKQQVRFILLVLSTLAGGLERLRYSRIALLR